MQQRQSRGRPGGLVGGKSRSRKKIAAVRRNGRLGGRPAAIYRLRVELAGGVKDLVVSGGGGLFAAKVAARAAWSRATHPQSVTITAPGGRVFVASAIVGRGLAWHEVAS
jgi:hypothetical protein